MGPACLSLDASRRIQVEPYRAEKRTVSGRLAPEDNVRAPDDRAVAEDVREEAVFRVGAQAIGDGDVGAAERDAHADRPGKFRARYVERSYSFIFRQSVTVLMFSASAARLRFPL